MTCSIASLSISGVPPFNGFWSKLIIVVALAMAGYWTLAIVTVLVSFGTLLSFAKVQRYVLEGPPSEHSRPAHEVPAGMAAAMVILAVLCLGAGVATPLFRTRIAGAAEKALQAGSENLPAYGQLFRAVGEAPSQEIKP